MGRKEKRIRQARQMKELRSLEQKSKVKRAITGTVCAGILLSNLLTPASSVYANEVEKTPTEQKTSEEQSQTELERKEGTTETESTGDESTILPEEATEQAVTTSEELVGAESTMDESEATEDSSAEEEMSTRAIITSTWGTCALTFDDETGVLTIGSGKLSQTDGRSNYLDAQKKIRKDTVTKIILSGDVVAPADSSYLFASLQIAPEVNYINLEEVVGKLDVSQATNMRGMFLEAYKLESIDVSDWDTSNVTQMVGVFAFNTSLKHIDVSNWDTSNATDMQSIFYEASSLESLDLSSWDTSKVTNMSNMLSDCTSLKEITLGSKSKFNSSVNLPAIPTASGEYSGAWERIDPTQVYASSSAFMGGYDGSMPGTYVWQKATDIVVKDSTIYVGSSWNTEDNFISAVKDGSPVDFSQLTVTGAVDTTTPGSYEVSYSYGGATKTATITVLEDQTNIKGKNSTIYAGTSWSPEDNFVSAMDRDGNTVDFSEVTVTGNVNTSVPGDYDVTYSYSDPVTGKKVTTTITVTVLEDQTSIKGKDSTIYTGTSWSPVDNFVSAADKDGSVVDFSEVTVSGSVDTTTPGDYEITYSYGGQSTTITVTVVEDQVTVVVKDTMIYTGTSWSPADNFISATDKDGNVINLAQVTVSGTVDTTTPGSYEVTYSYGGITKTATITVLEDQTSIEGKDSTIYTGTSWSPEDNFVSATDKDGNAVDFSAVTVSGTVDTTTPGDYQVTYTYGGQSTTITVTVVADQATLVVKDSTIYVGTPWTAVDNFVSATDREGNPIDFSQLLISGTVDNMMPGKYEVVYTYLPNTRAEGGSITETAIITVLEKEPVTPPTPVEPTTPVIPPTPVVPTTPAPMKPTETTQSNSALPKAGEQRLEATLLSLLGVGMAAGAAWFIGIGKRKKYENDTE